MIHSLRNISDIIFIKWQSTNLICYSQVKHFFCHLNTFSSLKWKKKNPTIWNNCLFLSLYHQNSWQNVLNSQGQIPHCHITPKLCKQTPPQHSTKIALSTVSMSLNLQAIIRLCSLTSIASFNTVDDPVLKPDSCLHYKYPMSGGIHWDRCVCFLLYYFVTLSGVSTGRSVFTSETHSWGGTSLPRSQIKNYESFSRKEEGGNGREIHPAPKLPSWSTHHSVLPFPLHPEGAE